MVALLRIVEPLLPKKYFFGPGQRFITNCGAPFTQKKYFWAWLRLYNELGKPFYPKTSMVALLRIVEPLLPKKYFFGPGQRFITNCGAPFTQKKYFWAWLRLYNELGKPFYPKIKLSLLADNFWTTIELTNIFYRQNCAYDEMVRLKIFLYP